MSAGATRIASLCRRIDQALHENRSSVTTDFAHIASLCRRIDQALQRSRPVIDPARDRTIREARRMRRAGATLAVIARKFGVSTALASKWCRDIDSGRLPRGVEAVLPRGARVRGASPIGSAPRPARSGLRQTDAAGALVGPDESEHAVPHANRVRQETRAIENRFRSGTGFRQPGALGTDPARQPLLSGAPAVEHADRGTE